jgi:predicted outer membrane protein
MRVARDIGTDRVRVAGARPIESGLHRGIRRGLAGLLHILVCNAGIMAPPEQRTAEGGRCNSRPITSGISRAPTDPRIADIALTAHSIDIDRGKLALSKTKNAEVKQFAPQMVDDHSAGVKEVVALATRLGVKPETNPTSKSLKDGAKRAAARLKKESGFAFDKDSHQHRGRVSPGGVDA